MNPQLEAVALQIYAPDHKHIFCEYEDETGKHSQCMECGHICQHLHKEPMEYETLASNGAFGYYDPPEPATEWHCVECGALVPPPPVEPGTDDEDDLPF